MTRLQRILVVLSLASYLLATTAIHALHDHSAAGHCCHNELSCDDGAFPTKHGDCADACDESARHDGHSSPTNCEDSCFACRFLAAKAMPAAVVLPVDRLETVCQLEVLPPALAPHTQLECFLCRGPPGAC
jgi:hypothetical protein